MNRSQYKDFLQSLKKHLARFLSIVAIIALGVGFFAGINAAQPDMVLSANNYYKTTNLMDVRTFNPFGFSKEDIENIKNIENVSQVEESINSFLLLKQKDNEYVNKVISLNKEGLTQNKLTILEGRLPQKSGEIVVDGSKISEKSFKVNDKVILEEAKETKDKNTSFSKASTDSTNLANDKILKRNDFTIVGKVKSPLYISYERGQANIGDGKIALFSYILEEDFNKTTPNELFIKVKDTSNLDANEKEYKDKVAFVKDKVDVFGKTYMKGKTQDIKNELKEAREKLDANKNEALSKINDGKEKIKKAKVDLVLAEDKLKEEKLKGENELKSSKEKIESYENEYNDGLKKYNDNLSLWENGFNKYKNGEAKLNEAKVLLDNAKYKLDNTLNILNTNKKDLDSNKKLLDDKKVALNNAKTLLDSNKGKIDSLRPIKKNLDSVIFSLNNINNKIVPSTSLNEVAFNEILASISKIDPNITTNIKNITNANDSQNAIKIKAILNESIKSYTLKLNEIKNQISKYDSSLNEYNMGVIKLNESYKLYEAGLKKYNDGLSQYNEGYKNYEKSLLTYTQNLNKLKESKKEIDFGKNELIYAKEKLDRAKSELNKANAKYREGLNTFNTKIREAEDKIKKANEEIPKKEEEIKKNEKELYEKVSKSENKILENEKKILDLPVNLITSSRDGNPDYTSYFENAKRIGKIAKIFPMFFFLVAALVSLTTITRMIEEERVQVGTLKALGYSNISISMKYLLYAFLASTLGSIIGLLFGLNIFPRVVMNSYGLMYSIRPFIVEFNLFYASLASLMAIITALLSAFFAIRQEIKDNPSSLMMPKSPEAGSKILLERIPFIWNKLSFSRKVTFRNLFRYKKRLIMTLLGISGCTALILTGFGIRDSIDGMVTNHFEKINLYNMYIMTDSKKDDLALNYVNDTKDTFIKSEKVYQETITIKDSTSDKKYEVSLNIFNNPKKASDFVSFYDYKNNERVQIQDDGIIITEKISRILNIKKGDNITYTDSDNNSYKVKVNSISENYLNNYIYMSPTYYKNIHKKEVKYNGIFTLINKDKLNDIEKIKEDTLKKDGVITVIATNQLEKTIKDQTKSLSLVVIVLTLSAGLLAFVVLYNLSNVNITERIRELATIKVLGFRDREVELYITRENIILTFLGALLGLALGVILHRYIMTSVEIDTMIFSKKINFISYIAAFLLTFIFSFIVNKSSKIHLNKIDMVESLKSVE